MWPFDGGAGRTFSHRWTGGRADRGGTGGASDILSMNFTDFFPGEWPPARPGCGKSPVDTRENDLYNGGRIRLSKSIDNITDGRKGSPAAGEVIPL